MKLPEYSCEPLNNYLYGLIPKDEWWRVSKEAEISPEFSCFADTYYHLSQVIPKDYTVIDFGAAYNAQAYFFTKHKKFIAVNPYSAAGDNGMFKPNNCEIYRMTTGEFLQKEDYPKNKVFAICNFVPNWHGENSIDLIHKKFQNVYTFYPSND